MGDKSEDYLKGWAGRAKKHDLKKLLTKVPNREPLAGDER